MPINTYQFFVQGYELIPAAEKGYYYVDITKIMSKDYDTGYVLSVTDGRTTYTMRYSVFSYCQKVAQKSSDTDLKSLTYAMYDYCSIAKARW